LKAESGTPIKAALAGPGAGQRISEGYGNMVLLDHGKGSAPFMPTIRKTMFRQGLGWKRAL